MTYNSAIHHRRSIRLQNYDYSQAGAYFVTLCLQNKACLFGDITNDCMALNSAGIMVMRWYTELENKFPDIQCDACICMPNHMHFVIVNIGAAVEANLGVRTNFPMSESGGSHLNRVLQWFKTMTTNDYIRGVKQNQWPPFRDKLWQRNYWEHVVRGEPELAQIREYIENNPKSWALDKLFMETQTNRL